MSAKDLVLTAGVVAVTCVAADYAIGHPPILPWFVPIPIIIYLGWSVVEWTRCRANSWRFNKHADQAIAQSTGEGDEEEQ